MDELEKLREKKSEINKEIKRLQNYSNVLNNGKIPYLCIKFGDEEYFIPQELVNVQKITGGAISKVNTALSRKKKELVLINFEIQLHEKQERIELTKTRPIKIIEY